MRLILLLVVLFGCFYLNETKHTVYVENIYPNYNDWVVINDFSVGKRNFGFHLTSLFYLHHNFLLIFFFYKYSKIQTKKMILQSIPSTSEH